MILLKKIISFNIFVFILLHSIIPHKHHSDMSYEENISEHDKADDIIDYFKLAFHNGLNNGLENLIFAEPIYKKIIVKNLTSKKAIITVRKVSFYKYAFSRLCFNNKILFPKQNEKQTYLRAPPC